MILAWFVQGTGGLPNGRLPFDKLPNGRVLVIFAVGWACGALCDVFCVHLRMHVLTG